MNSGAATVSRKQSPRLTVLPVRKTADQQAAPPYPKMYYTRMVSYRANLVPFRLVTVETRAGLAGN